MSISLFSSSPFCPFVLFVCVFIHQGELISFVLLVEQLIDSAHFFRRAQYVIGLVAPTYKFSIYSKTDQSITIRNLREPIEKLFAAWLPACSFFAAKQKHIQIRISWAQSCITHCFCIYFYIYPYILVWVSHNYYRQLNGWKEEKEVSTRYTSFLPVLFYSLFIVSSKLVSLPYSLACLGSRRL